MNSFYLITSKKCQFSPQFFHLFLSGRAEDEQRDSLQAADVLGRPEGRARPLEELRRRRRRRPLRLGRGRRRQDQGGGQGRQAQGEQVLQGQCEWFGHKVARLSSSLHKSMIHATYYNSM